MPSVFSLVNFFPGISLWEKKSAPGTTKDPDGTSKKWSGLIIFSTGSWPACFLKSSWLPLLPTSNFLEKVPPFGGTLLYSIPSSRSSAIAPMSRVFKVLRFIRASSEASKIKFLISLAFLIWCRISLGCVVSPV